MSDESLASELGSWSVTRAVLPSSIHVAVFDLEVVQLPVSAHADAESVMKKATASMKAHAKAKILFVRSDGVIPLVAFSLSYRTPAM